MKQATQRPASTKILLSLAAAVLVSVVASCGGRLISEIDTPKPQEASLRLDATSFDQLPGWKGDSLSQALAVFLRSCEKIKTLPPDRGLGPSSEMGRVSEWIKFCVSAALIHPGNETEARYFFESRFTPYLARNNKMPWAPKSRGLFTGYYEPELHGAWKPDTTYRYPIYARPKDLVSFDLGDFRDEFKGWQLAGQLKGNKFRPYPTRADIESGVLKGQQLELLWVDSAIDAFFLHVQGSGRVMFEDGSMIRVGYAGRNGRRYTPIGRELMAKGIIPQKKVSLQSIRQWLAANPIAGRQLMEKNKSYIFFRLIEGDGPIGAQGVVLTAGRSLAVDRKYIPLGVPVWLNTLQPGKSKTPLRRLVLAQDTGSAIQGPVRGDLFFGFGNDAGIGAGLMRENGTYYLLLPRKDSP